MKEVIAMHGWAGDSNQWTNWIRIFECCNWVWQSAERGYREPNPYKPKWESELNKSEFKRVAICHSLGSHLIDKAILIKATHVVLINSFSQFIPTGRENRSVKLALTKMMNAIHTPMEGSMLRKFQTKAHKPNEKNTKSIDSNSPDLSESGRLRLKNDLKMLMNTHTLPDGLNTYSKVLIVNSEQDCIIPFKTKKKLFEDLIKHMETSPTIINLQEEGHYISEVKTIKRIKEWLELNHERNVVTTS